MKEGRIVFTSDLIEGYCEEKNIDKKLFRHLYYFFVKELRELLMKPETISVYLRGLGTLYMTITGCNYETMRAEGLKERGFKVDSRIKRYKTRLGFISAEINNLKEKGIHRIFYFRRPFNPVGIKNNYE